MSKLRLKICGMKDTSNINEVAALMPDYMGFIFYKDSKRYVEEDFKMPEIVSTIKKVGVFVNETLKNVLDKVSEHQLDYVQLHGDETPEFCKELQRSTSIIKAFRIGDGFDLSVLKNYEKYCDHYLFDAATEKFGGSGKKFNWDVLDHKKIGKKYFLSGGIGIDSLAEIEKFRSVNADLVAIDVNSKFEIDPGIKDAGRLKQLKNELQG